MGTPIRWIAVAASLAVALSGACNGEPSHPPGNGNGGGNGNPPGSGGARPDIGARPWVPANPVAVYPPGRHSPLSPSVVGHLRAIAFNSLTTRRDVFAKIGDSHSVGLTFLECFAQFVDEGWSLGDHEHLRSTLDFFIRGDAAGTSPFERESLATRGGMSARWVINGDSPLLEQEVEAIRPRFAFLMFGTNDSGGRHLGDFTEDMLRIVDTLADWGVVPMMSTIPPHGQPDRQEAVDRFNGAIRAVAAVRNLPLVDLHGALVDLPNMGLRDDDVHLSVNWRQGGGQSACRMVDDGLEYGANVRNLVSLEQLERVSHAVLGGRAPDPEPPRLTGRGRIDDPVRMTGLPFSDGRRIADGDLVESRDLPPACSGADRLPGLVYQFTAPAPMTLHAALHTRFGSHGIVEIHSVEEGRCLGEAVDEVTERIQAGRHQVVVRLDHGADADARAEFVLSVVGR
jgi:hypothetical protein